MWFADPVRRILRGCQWNIWLASWLAPAEKRVAWRSRHANHVWHWVHFLAESGRLNQQQRSALAAYCRGLFADAFWQRFEREHFLSRLEQVRRAPSTCLAVITVLALGAALTSGAIPAAVSLTSSAIQRPERVCLISLDGKFRRLRSETLLDLAAAWKGSKLLTSVAPYSWGPGHLGETGQAGPIISAQVAPEFFGLLGVSAVAGRVFRPDDTQTCADCVVLNYATWQDQFHGDRRVVGRRITVNGGEKKIVGVLPRNFRLFTPEVGVWTLMNPEGQAFSNFAARIGAVARLKDGATETAVQAELADLTENAGYVLPSSLLLVTSAKSQVRRTLELYFLFVLLTVGGAAWIVYARSSGGAWPQPPASLAERCRWWGFFALKSVLLLAVTGLAVWAGVYWMAIHIAGTVYPAADGIVLWLFLIVSVAPLSWSIHDQRRRCRVCLRRLGIPVRVGAPGHVLLNWSGTEMVCSEGHGILYLPDREADVLERERWNKLDDSWNDLFRME